MTRIALILLAMSALVGCAPGGTQEPRPTTPGATATSTASASSVPAAACRTTYPATLLPGWARTGFSDPEPSVPHVLSDRGDIAAILWDSHRPLTAPPTADRNNKVLWVAKVGRGAGPLEIRASLAGTGTTVTRTVEPAPGPSILDLPSPGCWSLALSWGRHRDHLELGYAAG